MDNILTKEQKTYIKNNLSTQSLTEIAKCLKVDSEIICNFIISELISGNFGLEDIQKNLEDLGFLKDIEPFQPSKTAPYSISFELDDAGDVQIHMEWPNKDNSEEFVENIGILLHMIHSGKIKSMIGRNLTQLAQDNNMEKEVLDVIHKWNELEGLDNSKPCVNPLEVF
tara:strand:- start:47 stop:553 length:507 start_codon:yes stop_codon:yes gene_type:complete